MKPQREQLFPRQAKYFVTFETLGEVGKKFHTPRLLLHRHAQDRVRVRTSFVWRIEWLKTMLQKTYMWKMFVSVKRSGQKRRRRGEAREAKTGRDEDVYVQRIEQRVVVVAVIA